MENIIEKLNQIKEDYHDYNIIVSVEKEYDDFESECIDCENSNAILMVRGRKKKQSVNWIKNQVAWRN